MAFVLFGPYGGPEPRREVEWLQESPDSSAGPGRDKDRKIKLEDQKKGHSMNTSYVVNADALPFEQKVIAASVAQHDEADATWQYDSDLMCHQLEVASLMKKLKE